ncbi:TPA: hypothetical protein ACIX8V_004853, partial [Escherichia coli]
NVSVICFSFLLSVVVVRSAQVSMFNRYGGFFCYLLVFTVTAQEVFDEPSVQCSVVPGNMTCLFQPFPAIELLQRYRFF